MSTAGTTTLFGTAALAARYADDLLLGTVRDVHGAVAKRVWGTVSRTNATGSPSRVVHDTVTRTIYGGLSAGLQGGARACDAADRRGLGPRTDATPKGRFVLSVVNGLIGDRLVDEAPGSAITMAVRAAGRDVPAEPGPLAEAFPEATGDVIVFVHGLMEHDESWFRRRGELGSYGDQLATGGPWTPVYLRINTGLALSENGVGLASLMDALVQFWPVPVQRVAFVGHSLGGLVIRAACAVSTDSAEPWNRLVTNVVFLGTPHLGAPLERAVALGSRALGVLPESAPLARILEYRSVGILDLRQGLAADVQNLPHARYHLVSATLGSTVWHPLSLGLGDLLVRHPSAMGRGRHGEMFPGADTLHLPNSDHFDLLNHPDVHRKLKEWLA
jgi:pimeloyl-ACP methyl ester carboxylesterase